MMFNTTTTKEKNTGHLQYAENTQAKPSHHGLPLTVYTAFLAGGQ